jgi:hypothetical protein
MTISAQPSERRAIVSNARRGSCGFSLKEYAEHAAHARRFERLHVHRFADTSFDHFPGDNPNCL